MLVGLTAVPTGVHHISPLHKLQVEKLSAARIHFDQAGCGLSPFVTLRPKKLTPVLPVTGLDGVE
jgi:hypothetical protein